MYNSDVCSKMKFEKLVNGAVGDNLPLSETKKILLFSSLCKEFGVIFQLTLSRSKVGRATPSFPIKELPVRNLPKSSHRTNEKLLKTRTHPLCNPFYYCFP